MKPREFWIQTNKNDFGTHYFCSSCAPRPPTKAIHVREVVPIDWKKVWDSVEENAGYDDASPIFEIRQLIKKSVENQLKGEE